MMQRRPYQIDCLNGIDESFKEFQKVIAILPTGSGKTVIASGVAKKYVDAGKRVLFLAHRQELLTQTMDKFIRADGLPTELEKAESKASKSASVVVASVQSLTNEKRLTNWPSNHFDLVIIDECHHTLAGSYQKVLTHFNSARVVGITATADRADKRSLGEYFENIAYEIGLFDLIRDGYLSPITIKSVPLQIDLNGVRQTAGDFNDADLGSAIEPYLGQIAESIAREASFRKTLAFLPLRATSRKFVEACQAIGLSACHIDGESEDRKEILQRFTAGEFDVLSNAMLLTEGYDEPSCDCVCVLRPTRSRPLYSQMVGRGTRLHPTKENLLLLDFLWMHEKLSISKPAHLIAKTKEEAEAITELAEERSQSGYGEQELDLDLLATDATAKREEALRKRLDEQAKKKAKYVSAEMFAAQHNDMALAEYEPTMKWEGEAISDKQRWHLKRNGIDPDTVKGKGHASRLLSLAFSNQKLQLASPNVVAMVRRMPHIASAVGIHDFETVTSRQGAAFFAELNKRKAAKIR